MRSKKPLFKLVVPLPKIGRYLVDSVANLNFNNAIVWGGREERKRIVNLLESKVDHSAIECNYTCLTHRYVKLIVETGENSDRASRG